MEEPFDFVRYFTRVHQAPVWQRMQREMAAWAGAQPGDRLLDVGSGPGWLVAALRQDGIRAFGADGDPRMADVFRRLYPWPYVIGEARFLPLATAAFDVVTAGNILFFLPMPLRALREMARVVRPGGSVAVWNPSEKMSVPAMRAHVAGRPELDDFEREHLPRWAEVAEGNRRWSAAELSRLFAAAGLQDFRTKTTLDGLARYGRGRRPDLEQEHA